MLLKNTHLCNNVCNNVITRLKNKWIWHFCCLYFIVCFPAEANQHTSKWEHWVPTGHHLTSHTATKSILHTSENKKSTLWCRDEFLSPQSLILYRMESWLKVLQHGAFNWQTRCLYSVECVSKSVKMWFTNISLCYGTRLSALCQGLPEMWRGPLTEAPLLSEETLRMRKLVFTVWRECCHGMSSSLTNKQTIDGCTDYIWRRKPDRGWGQGEDGHSRLFPKHIIWLKLRHARLFPSYDMPCCDTGIHLG